MVSDAFTCFANTLVPITLPQNPVV